MSAPSPYPASESGRIHVAKLDGRRRQARVQAKAAAQLTAHVGAPSALESRLIARAAALEARLLEMDTLPTPSASDTTTYIALHTTYIATLKELRL